MGVSLGKLPAGQTLSRMFTSKNFDKPFISWTHCLRCDCFAIISRSSGRGLSCRAECRPADFQMFEHPARRRWAVTCPTHTILQFKLPKEIMRPPRTMKAPPIRVDVLGLV